MSSILEKIRKDFQNHSESKTISLEELQHSHDSYNKLEQHHKEIEEELNEYTQSFIAHIPALEMCSIFMETILEANYMKKYRKIILHLEKLYMPGQVPLTPITDSFFQMWLLFDFQIEKRSISQMWQACFDIFPMPEELMIVAENAQKSRCGIYKYISACKTSGLIQLRELITDHTIYVMSPDQITGKKNQLWLVRLFPPLPEFGYDYYTMATTPYILTGHTEKEWIQYFIRQDIYAGTVGSEERLCDHMRYGKCINYWLEYVYQALQAFYYSDPFIYLAGIPDLEHTLPRANGPLTLDFQKRT